MKTLKLVRTLGIAAIVGLCTVLPTSLSMAQVPTLLGDLSPGPGLATVNADPANYALVDGRIFFTAGGRGPGTTTDGQYAYSMLPDGSDVRNHGRLSFGVTGGDAVVTVLGRVGDRYVVGVGSMAFRIDKLIAFRAGSDHGTILLTYGPFQRITSPKVVHVSGRAFIVSADSFQGSVHVVADGEETANLIYTSAGGIDSPIFSLNTTAAALGNSLVFVGNDSSGRQPWISDGTPEGTRQIAAISSDPFAGGLQNLTTLGSQVVFIGPNGGSGIAIWKTDGTADGTVLVRNLPGVVATAGESRTIGSRVVMTLSGLIVSTDGTSDGTFAITQFSTGEAIPGIANPPVVIGGRVVFSSSAPDGHTFLGSTDGTVAGTVVLANLATPLYRVAGAPVVNQSTVFLQRRPVGTTPLTVTALIRTDGTTAGTTVQSLESSPAFPSTATNLPIEGGVLFTASPPDADPLQGVLDNQPWQSDGTPESTRQLTQVIPNAPAGGVAILGRLGERAALTSSGSLFLTDGSTTQAVGQTRVRNTTRPWAELGAGAIFAGGGAPSGPWITDGTAAGTSPIFPSGALAQSEVSYLTTLNGFVYFARVDVNGYALSLYRTDGTAAGTSAVYEDSNRTVTDVAAFGGQIWFLTRQLLGGSVQSLYRSDGTAQGNTLVRTIGQGSVYFIGSTADRLYVRWEVSGSTIRGFAADGTSSAVGLSNFAYSTVTDGTALYFARNLVDRSGDVTVSQQIIRVAPPGPATVLYSATTNSSVNGNTRARRMALLGNRIIFVGSEPASGSEPWAFDQSTQQATLLRDIFPGIPSSNVERMQTVGNRVYFVAVSPDAGRQLWSTDGTPEGTRQIPSINTLGLSSVEPEQTFPAATGNDRFALLGSRVLFAADDGLVGEEPWLVSTCAADFNSDGAINADDLGDFITAYFDSPPGNGSDFNSDGVVNADDLGDFITAYFNGCP